MSAATSTNSCSSSSSNNWLQHQEQAGRSRLTDGGSGGSGKRVSWKLASMATPESDDDFDVLDVDFYRHRQTAAPVFGDRYAEFYNATQEDRGRNPPVSSRNGICAHDNGTASDGAGWDASSTEQEPIERAWAVVATSNLAIAATSCNNALVGLVEHNHCLDRPSSYVVTSSFCIARPENGPELVQSFGNVSDDSSSGGDDHQEHEVVLKSTSVNNCKHHLCFLNGEGSSLSTLPTDHIQSDDQNITTENHYPQLISTMSLTETTTSATDAFSDPCSMEVVVPPPSKHFVVVAIDFGTALSGYAFGFVRDPGRSVHMMRRWEGGDPGVINQKTPTALLLDPEGRFHSFGCAARDFYHDLDEEESRTWMYFDKFKMALHYDQNLNHKTLLSAANGRQHSALAVFAHALRYFREHAVREMTEQSSTSIMDDDIRWVITVPAIWKPAAKQFMRQAAIEAGLTSPESPDRLLIALEPEAASVYVRTLRLYQLVPDMQKIQPLTSRNSRSSCYLAEDGDMPAINFYRRSLSRDITYDDVMNIAQQLSDVTVEQDAELEGSRCLVVDCGGGTVDITVHEIDPTSPGRLREVYKATGGPYGSVGVDLEFEKLLTNIFGLEFIEAYKRKRPSGWVDLMVAFESRKRSASPKKDHPLNICLPFSFIDYHKKHKGNQVENAINKYGDKSVRWSSQGMLRLTLEAMKRLFAPTLEQIKKAVFQVIDNVEDVGCLFLVGGFAESPILQQDLRCAFSDTVKIFVPQDVALTVLKGAVYFGLDPAVITRRRSMLTYGVEVLNNFNPARHPASKRIRRGGQDWCTGIFDVFVRANQDVDLGQTMVRRYAPPSAEQSRIVINIYSSERSDVQFVTDPQVVRCGQLRLDLTVTSATPTSAANGVNDGRSSDSICETDDARKASSKCVREVQTTMTFGDTEIKVRAVDVSTGRQVLATVDFLGHL